MTGPTKQYSPSTDPSSTIDPVIFNFRRKLLAILSYSQLKGICHCSLLGTCSCCITEGSSETRRQVGRYFEQKFKPRSKPLPENIAFSRLTAPGSPRMLKGWPEMLIIYRLQPNSLGIKLRVEDDWHFGLHKQ